MKKQHFYIPLLSLFLLSSCQKETEQVENVTTNPTSKANWATSKLDNNFSKYQQNVNCYLFKKEDFVTLANDASITKVRFVLGFDDNSISINAIGINGRNEEVKTVFSSKYYESSFANKIIKLNEASENKTNSNAIINQHLLSPKEAFNYIKKWQSKLTTNSDLNTITSYDSERIRYYSLEKEVVLDMTKMSTAENFAIFLGLNKEGKMTTIFAGLDKNKNIILPQSHSELKAESISGSIYDFTLPCPSTCDK